MKTYLSVPEFFGVSDVNTTQLIHRKVFDFVPTHSTKIRCDQRKQLLFFFVLGRALVLCFFLSSFFNFFYGF